MSFDETLVHLIMCLDPTFKYSADFLPPANLINLCVSSACHARRIQCPR